MKFYLVLNFDVSMHFKFVFVVIQHVSFSYIRCDIPDLKSDKYKVQKEILLLYLGWMDIDYTIRKDELLAITNTSTSKDIVLYEQ